MYRAQPGLYDEMVDAEGAVRPHWRALLDRFDALGPEALNNRFEAADRHLKESGVSFRVYSDADATERPWPLSHMPLLISAEDWKHIKSGVLQRVELIEALLADVYGPQQFIKDGLLPASAIAGSPEFLRPMVGVPPVGGRYLAFYAIDLGRSPSGDWWVIRDRAQGPSGAGYAQENRNAMSRALSDVYRGFNVERLGSFFEAYRGWMSSFRTGDDAGTCLLTPGRLNETFFEHAFLARHLGFRLVEGQDLTVRNQQVFLRTIAGLRRIGALWRRVDSDFCDPLELNQRSQLGVPGLVQAVRQGNVMVANALGSGLGEAFALMGFLPALAKKVMDQSLLLPNVATWWCGQETERRYVLDNLDRLVVAPAFVSRLPGILDHGPTVVAEMDPGARAALVEAIERRGVDFVGQEVVKLSTTPVWTKGTLEPRPFELRVFVAATADGWNVMPGGFGLIGDRIDARAVSMQQGARSCDVWVLSDSRVADPSHLAPAREVTIRRSTGALPSRAADNLFWLARYLERTEATLRIVRSMAALLVEERSDISALVDILFKWGASPQPYPTAGDAAAAQALFGTGPGAIPALIRAARNAAAAIRDRFPRDTLQALDDLNAFIVSTAQVQATTAYVLDKANTALRIIAAVAGFQNENMNRLSGWRFFQLGHRIERAINTCRTVRQFGGEASTPDTLDTLLEWCESQRTYRVRYLHGASRGPVLDLILIDESNPRSLAFSIADIVTHTLAMPRTPNEGDVSSATSMAQELLNEVRAFDVAKLGNEQLLACENGLMRLSNEISQLYFTVREPAPASVS
ncbi:MAG TPA: circularly permuted type 2 ATP-grasp protein [Magnetospirillaceae bacterium]|jgi:uncharacterized circularly permuted ATP-grasp superfamily protein/uncharacterized alpha-E superfamily protein